MKLLKAKAISHAFDYPLFNGVDIELDSGESIAIIGISGSGKSTLLHILSTLLTPKEGEVELLGEKLSQQKKNALVQMRRNDLGLIFQSHYLIKGFSAYENLEVASMLSNEPIENKLLVSLGIDKVIRQKVTELSGGQQQRVSIARVLTKKPRVIFADEPTGNLDLETASEVMELLSGYIKEHDAGMVLVTHDNDLAMRCDKVYRIQDEQLVQIK
ncbi:MAG: ABC transporter ATP-binding protein [Helicobacteraceae bacterium 4484_230]|nr:MAG: ABC transporter ATP-binding protein [Helicobacteraceae bacterium 4484_230]